MNTIPNCVQFFSARVQEEKRKNSKRTRVLISEVLVCDFDTQLEEGFSTTY